MPTLNQQLLENYQGLDAELIRERKPPTMPEKIIQFGTGNFLRGFVDYYIDKANKQGHYDGRVVTIQSTGSDTSKLINQQDGLYTHCINGIKHGQEYEEIIINNSISRALSATEDWEACLKLAQDPNIEYVFSNTTEAGITYEEDEIKAKPPKSFPGKLLAMLYHRYETLGESNAPGWVILPCELILDNGAELLQIVMRLSDLNGLSEHFKRWLQAQNLFCNTLVDRIVPGKPEGEIKEAMDAKTGYEDGLMVCSEPYKLFAIQPPAHKTLSLPWAEDEDSIVIEDGISMFRERKLRLLNGVHTISVGLAHLMGIQTVREMTEHPAMNLFLQKAMEDEIVEAMDYDKSTLQAFSIEVLDRFRNPFIQHKILSITLQYTKKMRARNADTFVRFFRKFKKTPPAMTFGFAAYLYFLHPLYEKEGKWYGELNGEPYEIKDAKAAYWAKAWKEADLSTAENATHWVSKQMKNAENWPSQMVAIKDFDEKVGMHLYRFEAHGVASHLEEFLESYEGVPHN